MLLRPRQELFVNRALEALGKHGNTLGVAPTGAGKTVMASAICSSIVKDGGRVLFLQHRDELVAQNKATLHKFDPTIRSSVIDAKRRDPHGQVVFAMVQSLVNHPGLMRDDITDVITDETHHSAAKSYQVIYDCLPQARKTGLTATPGRADKKRLNKTYNNVCDVISLTELIKGGFLVRPRCFVIDLGVQDELRRVKRTASDFDMGEVEAIMDKQVHNDTIIQKWSERAADRPTVIFCATVAHAKHVSDAFLAAGIAATWVDGTLSKQERAQRLADYDKGTFRVLCNVAVLVEGWDHQPTSCIVLLRPSSAHSTMTQMIGRGLRKVDPERYPGVHKSDCLILDFGISILTHGNLDQDAELSVQEADKAKLVYKKVCPDCLAEVPANVLECPLCGHEFPPVVRQPSLLTDKATLHDVALAEIDILDASPFKWEVLFDGSVMAAYAFSAWAMAIEFDGFWHAVGGSEDAGIHLLAAYRKETAGGRPHDGLLYCLETADDWMRSRGNKSDAGKAKTWLLQPPSDKQRQLLGAASASMTKYQASCHLAWKFNEKAIKAKVMSISPRIAA